jgi:SAM-dependent methyltransferase
LKNPQDIWYKSWFNTQDYLDLYKHRDEEDAKRIVTLLFKNIKLNKGSDVLDLACGNGRHSVLFVKRGYNVTGIDLSEFLIKQAKEKLKKEYRKYLSNLRFEIRDMRNINHEKEFDLVVNIFTSFGYFESDKDNEKVIHSVSRSLKPGGYFLLDFINNYYLVNKIVHYDIKRERGKIIIQVREISNGFVQKDILIFRNDSARGKYPIFNRFREKIRLYSIKDFESMFSKHKLKILEKFGNYSGSHYNINKSERLIILAQKK